MLKTKKIHENPYKNGLLTSDIVENKLKAFLKAFNDAPVVMRKTNGAYRVVVKNISLNTLFKHYNVDYSVDKVDNTFYYEVYL